MIDIINYMVGKVVTSLEYTFLDSSVHRIVWIMVDDGQMQQMPYMGGKRRSGVASLTAQER